jgi:hypothetical protein
VRLYSGANLNLLTIHCKMRRVELKVLKTRKQREEMQLPASWQVPSLCTCSPRQISDHDTVGTSHPYLSDAQLRSSSSQGSFIPNQAWRPLQLFHTKPTPRAQYPRARPQMIGGAPRRARAEWREVERGGERCLPWLQCRMWRRSNYAIGFLEAGRPPRPS